MNSEQEHNIVFIVIDTHRRDRLGMYGYNRNTSPNLDEFASGAIIYEHAVSPAQWTIPAHASMFSGEYPSTHLTTQSGHSLDPYFRTLAEWLSVADYRRIGFCNNPLVGVIDNGLKRGFETFYNYGGAFPSIPAREAKGIVASLSKGWERYTQLLRRISYPIQNAVARSEKVLNFSLNPIFVPLWTSLANFKGNTARSIEDVTTYLEKKVRQDKFDKHFVFVNLMETHLPFTPPESFVSRFVPYLKTEHAARDFMRVYNTKALRWLLPMEEPFSELEFRTLSDFYDAEVAYQDHLLENLLIELNTPYHQENTMVIIVADHGEMLGEHQFMGHSFRVFQELVQVPLVIRYPGGPQGRRVPDVISTNQLFHTVLDFSGVLTEVGEKIGDMDDLYSQVNQFSLLNHRVQKRSKTKAAFSEAYPPDNVIKILEKHEPKLIDDFQVRSTFRAAYDQYGHKLIRADGFSDSVYNIAVDKSEQNKIEIVKDDPSFEFLSNALDRFQDLSRSRQPEQWSRSGVNLDDEVLRQRLRNLGYLE